MLRCIQCNIWFAGPDEMTDHIMSLHHVIYQCKHCPKFFQREGNLKLHARNKHPRGKAAAPAKRGRGRPKKQQQVAEEHNGATPSGSRTAAAKAKAKAKKAEPKKAKAKAEPKTKPKKAEPKAKPKAKAKPEPKKRQRRPSSFAEKKDAHQKFFNSLLPHVRKFSDDQTLVFRSELLSMVQHYNRIANLRDPVHINRVIVNDADQDDPEPGNRYADPINRYPDPGNLYAEHDPAHRYQFHSMPVYQGPIGPHGVNVPQAVPVVVGLGP